MSRRCSRLGSKFSVLSEGDKVGEETIVAGQGTPHYTGGGRSVCSVQEGASEEGTGQVASCWHSGRMRLDDRYDGTCGKGDSFVHVGANDIDKRGQMRSRTVSDV